MKKAGKKNAYIPRVLMMVLTTVLIGVIVAIMLVVGQIQGTARVVNYAGLVRGETQRIVKLENAGLPQDGMIDDVTSFIAGLRFGSNELQLVRLNDVNFQNKMAELSDEFETLKKEIQLVRSATTKPILSSRVRTSLPSATRQLAWRRPTPSAVPQF